MKIKLAVISGGSVNWMRGLMRDVYTLEGVEGGEIRLVDPNTEHVTSVRNMADEIQRKTDEAMRAFGGDERLCFSSVGIDGDTPPEAVRKYLGVFRENRERSAT